MSKEITIPKMYVYTVDGVLDKEDNLKKFSIASLSKDIHDDFDLEGISNSAALFFFLDNEEYQDPSMWPLMFKFHTKESLVEIEMNLSFSPAFTSTPRKTIQTKKIISSSAIVPEKKTRKIKK